MIKIKRLSSLTLALFLLLSFCLPIDTTCATEGSNHSHYEPIDYIFDPSSGEFVKSTQRDLQEPSLEFQLGNLQEFSVKPNQYTNESKYRVKLISANYNEQKSKNAPYTGLKKLGSIANGQTKKVSSSENLTCTSIASITKMKSSNTSFNIGFDFKFDKPTSAKPQDVSQLILKNMGYSLTLSSVLNVALGKQYTFKKSYSYTEKDTTIESISKKVEETFEIPNLPKYESCNSADFYIYWDHEIYDMKAEIWDVNGTTDPSKGLIEIEKIHLGINENGSNYFYCPHCDAQVPYFNMGGEAVYHLLYADGHTEHVSEHRYLLEKEIGEYKLYKPNPDTIIDYEFSHPIIKGQTIPWNLHEKSHENLIADKPLHMILPGSEEIIYDNGKYYLLRVFESQLIDSGNRTEKTQLGLPVLPGLTQNVEIIRNFYVKSLRHEKITTGKSSRPSLIGKFFSLLSIGGGTSSSSSTIKETTDITEKSLVINETNTYILPSFFINAGYSGGVLYLGKDYLTFMVKGEMIPVAPDGSFDESQKTSVSFKHTEEFPKIFLDPYQ